jgi:hypothetical protein
MLIPWDRARFRQVILVHAEDSVKMKDFDERLCNFHNPESEGGSVERKNDPVHASGISLGAGVTGAY